MLNPLLLLLLLPLGPVPQEDDTPRSSTHLRFLWQDVDGDGRRDALVIDRRGAARLLVANGEGDFADRTVELGLGRLGPVREAVWGDAEGDGRPELVVVDTRGEPHLLAADAAGSFDDVTALAGLSPGVRCTLPEWLDFDADGSSDLMLHTEGSALLFRGDGNGAFEPVDLGLRTVPPQAPPAVLPRSGAGAQPEGEAGGTSSAELPPAGLEHPLPGSGGRQAAAAPTVDVDRPPGGGTLPDFGPPSGICASSVLDQALGGCLKASSIPTLGMLYPLGSELFIDAASGEVGLGSLSPETSLHVATGGDVGVSGGGFLQLGNQSGENLAFDQNEIMARKAGNPSSLWINFDGGDVMVGNEVTNGRFGVGTTTPQYDLHVRGDGTTGSIQVTPNVANANAELRLAENTSASLGMLMRYDGTKNDLEVRGVTSGGETGVHFFVDRDSGVAGFPTSSAKVGIGTSSPSGQLHVSGSGGDGSVVLPLDAIGSGELFGEMGIASDVVTPSNVLDGSGPVNLAGRTIVTPTSGFVLALGTLDLFNFNSFTGESALLSVRWSQTGKETPEYAFHVDSLGNGTVTIQGLFSVPAGSHTFFLEGFTNGLDLITFYPRLTLLFVPTAYGTTETEF